MGVDLMATTVHPIGVECPACFAKPGKPCTAPTDTTRKTVRWFHWSRSSNAIELGRKG